MRCAASRSMRGHRKPAKPRDHGPPPSFETPAQVGFTRLAPLECRSRVNPRSGAGSSGCGGSAAHAAAMSAAPVRAARPQDEGGLRSGARGSSRTPVSSRCQTAQFLRSHAAFCGWAFLFLAAVAATTISSQYRSRSVVMEAAPVDALAVGGSRPSAARTGFSAGCEPDYHLPGPGLIRGISVSMGNSIDPKRIAARHAGLGRQPH
jgi:hypothetical protein